MYLKRPDRIQALAYVVLMAVLVKNLSKVRRAMKVETEPLMMPGKKKSWEPTGDKILDLFSGIDVVMMGLGNSEFSMGRRFSERLFRLVGFSPDVYLRVFLGYPRGASNPVTILQLDAASRSTPVALGVSTAAVGMLVLVMPSQVILSLLQFHSATALPCLSPIHPPTSQPIPIILLSRFTALHLTFK